MASQFSEFDSIIALARSSTMTAADVAELATRLANSGARLTIGGAEPLTDIASTGGPGSLSTILTPLDLRSFGCRVVKLAVPGRPAGGVDALATVPGYSVRLTEADIRRAIALCGYAHFIGEGQFAPMDAQLFGYRRATGAVAVPPLAAASLLAKKIAVGLHVVGLDVRVGPHGNFGATMDEARSNARLFCEAAHLVGIKAVAFLYGLAGAEQPWIGRGESLAAVDDVLFGLATGDLAAHAERCFRMAAVVAEAAGVGPRDLASADTSAARLKALTRNLEAQGTTLSSFRARAAEVRSAPRRTIRAPESGVLMVDMATLRDALVEAQAEAESRYGESGFSDPAGVVLHARAGETVDKGTTLAAVRTVNYAAGAKIVGRLATALEITESQSALTWTTTMEIVRA